MMNALKCCRDFQGFVVINELSYLFQLNFYADFELLIETQLKVIANWG